MVMLLYAIVERTFNFVKIEINEIPNLPKPANGRRYRQGRDVADKTTRRQIRRWGQKPESADERPHLSGARGVGQVLPDDS
jgi:hypothetical protein